MSNQNSKSDKNFQFQNGNTQLNETTFKPVNNSAAAFSEGGVFKIPDGFVSNENLVASNFLFLPNNVQSGDIIVNPRLTPVFIRTLSLPTQQGFQTARVETFKPGQSAKVVALDNWDAPVEHMRVVRIELGSIVINPKLDKNFQFQNGNTQLNESTFNPIVNSLVDIMKNVQIFDILDASLEPLNIEGWQPSSILRLPERVKVNDFFFNGGTTSLRVVVNTVIPGAGVEVGPGQFARITQLDIPSNKLRRVRSIQTFPSGSTGSNTGVVDNLESESAEEALSANQGRVLSEKIDGMQKYISMLMGQIEELKAKFFGEGDCHKYIPGYQYEVMFSGSQAQIPITKDGKPIHIKLLMHFDAMDTPIDEHGYFHAIIHEDDPNFKREICGSVRDNMLTISISGEFELPGMTTAIIYFEE